MVKRIRNFTRGAVNIIDKDGNMRILPSEGEIDVIVRRTTEGDRFITKNGEEIVANRSVVQLQRELPPPQEGVVYIVSSFVYYELCYQRQDVFVISEPIKDKGELHVKAARSISRPRHGSIERLLNTIKTTLSAVDYDTVGEKNIEVLFELKKIIDASNLHK